MFGRATIRLGIGPNSSVAFYNNIDVKFNDFRTIRWPFKSIITVLIIHGQNLQRNSNGSR